MHLYQAISHKVNGWRNSGYPQDEFPVIAEILEWAANPDGSGFQLRKPQVNALETYWYPRLVQNTPHILFLNKHLFPKTKEMLDALGVPGEAFEEVDYQLDTLFERIVSDDGFVKRFKLDTLREIINLDYPSYILALAMAAGKTKLIGAIFATEFAMSLEYPADPFVQNALVFAPGKTIIESLRQLAETEFDRILPSRLYKPFAASIKITFTRDCEKTIPVIPDSYFNVIVTNTEKIRIQKETIRKGDLDRLFSSLQEEQSKLEVANARLQAIASLPHLGIFSDEAHHTYGQSLDTDLKKVRKTVDYLAQQTNVVCVVNTTGTPYFKNQPLRDGTPAKLAIYFPQTDDDNQLRPLIETKLLALGLNPTLVFEHHTGNENKEEFDRFKTRSSPHRIALLVNRGVKGWDVPALFACALARRLQSRNNFDLQAASRCLRQVPGNKTKARIYLSIENQSILDKQLQETYGETIADLNNSHTRTRTATIRIRKIEIPPVVVRQLMRTVVLKENGAEKITLHKPEGYDEPALTRTTYTIREQESTRSVLAHWEAWREKAGEFGFHYTPYNFDSNPEQSFFESMLGHLQVHSGEVEDIYFSGAITDPQKTDFFVEYKGEDGKWHRYTPDFILRRKDGKCLIVEIKNAQFEAATNNDLQRSTNGEAALTVEGRKAVAARRWEELNPDRLKYQIIFVREDTLAYDQTTRAKEFIEKE